MFKKITKIAVSIVMPALVSMLLSACATKSLAPNIDRVETKPEAQRAMLHTRLARGYMEQKQYATARDELEKALRLDPKHSDSNYVMGLLMIQLNNNKDAEYYLGQAVKSNSENSSAAHDFGMFLCQIGKEQDSIKYFEIAASNPLFNQPELSYMRAGECLDRINDPRAEKFLKRALESNPKMRPALYRLAILNRKNGNNLSARAYIERYLAITKPQPEALLLAFEIESSLRAFDVAETYRKRILENFPGTDAAEKLRSPMRSN